MRSGVATPASGPAAVRGAAAERYRVNTPRHLIGISRDLQTRLLRRLGDEDGHAGLRPSFGPLFAVLWEEGLSLAAVADRLGTSRQACSQLANLAESAGYVARRAGGADRRSKLLVLTRRGRALAADAVRVILATQDDYRALVGDAAFARFARSLGALYEGLGIPTHASGELAARARGSIGVLPLVATRIEQELMRATIPRGHPALRMSFGQVLPFIGPRGGRVNEIARLQRVSRQAISTTSRELESLGYLRREPDPRDGRCALLQLTARGARLIADSVASVDALETRFAATLGAARMRELQRTARLLYDRLHLEEEIFGGGEVARAAAPRPAPADGIERLARALRRRLGTGDAARLAALLDSTTRAPR